MILAMAFLAAASGGGSGGGGTPTPTPTPGQCQTIPNTSICVGAASFGIAVGSCPTETNPQDPINFGADKTGVNDSSAAISNAIASGVSAGGNGDIFFGTPGTYRVDLSGSGTYINSKGIIPPANAKMECAPGVTLKMSAATLGNHDGGIFVLFNGGNAVCGCDFQGPLTGPTPKSINLNAEGNWLVDVQGGSNYLIEDNTFENSQGNSAVGTSDNPSSNVTVTYNTFSGNPFYCFVIDQTTTTATISHNLGIDCILGAEFDACPNGGTVGTNINFVNNYIQSQGGTCQQASQAGCSGDGYTGPGYGPAGSGATSCNYSGITIGGSAAAENYCVGPSSGFTAMYGAVCNGAVSGALCAHESNNLLGSNCVCNSGTGSC